MRVKIRLDTQSDAIEFVSIVSKVPEDVSLRDGQGKLHVNAKSIIGALYTVVDKFDFSEIWCECDKDIYTLISKFVVVE